MQNMMNMMEQMKVYMPMIQQFMSSISGEDNGHGGINFDGLNLGETDIMDMLKNMMSEEQQAMFSMFMDGNI